MSSFCLNFDQEVYYFTLVILLQLLFVFMFYHRERQQQLEELTRELKRVTEESEVIKSKLVSTKSSNQV